MMPLLRVLALLALSMLLPQAAANELAISIPVAVGNPLHQATLRLAATEFRPDGPGPFPLAIINHGSPRLPADRANTTGRYQAQSAALVTRGFVVINPVRRGYGKSEGSWAEGYSGCNNPAYYEAGLETARDIAATIDYAKTQPHIDASRILMIGKSAGGFGALALASQQPAGVRGVVNFAGGRGSMRPNEVCNEGRLLDAFARYASTTSVPMLWLYAENDQFFGPVLASRMLQAYRSSKVDVSFVALPPFGKDGHAFFDNARNIDAWAAQLDPFLQKIGLGAGGH